MGRLDRKVAVVTGAASGIGRATAERFVAEGARVVAGDVLDDDGAALAAALGARAVFLHADVAREEDVSALVALALARFGRVDCLVNNAGIGGVPGEIHALDLGDAYARTVGVLLTGVIAGTKHAARVMREQRAGSIVNVASVAGLAAGYGHHVYSALKAAVLSLTRTAGAELGPFGVRVNAICPGGIATPMFVGGAEAPREDLPRAMVGVRALLGRVQPIPRCGEPEDVAQAAVFLASDESTFMTGQAVVVDGGLLAGAGARAMAEALRGGVDGSGS